MLAACGDDKAADAGSETAGSETADTGTATGDEIGDSGTTTGDGDTTTTTTTDSTTTTTDGSCSVGSEGCECTQGGGCDPGLECTGGICTPPAPDTTGGGTTETTETTGANTACAMDMSFEILAVDATNANGWDPFMSMLGEGMIMAWDQQTNDATISWDIDVPCDDIWHIWVRGIDQGQADSYFATVDGMPNPAPIFELDCTNNPNQGTYVWKELNWRDLADPGCTYLEDPWMQDWLIGIHQFELTYRESGAVSKLWITNTDLTPP